MAFSSGAFTRTNGTNTGSTLWASDKSDGTKITASNHDTHDQDLANGINATVLKAGTNTHATSAGTNTVTLTLTPAATAYSAGQTVTFKAGGTNTGAATLNISGLGAKAIQKLGAALVAGDITQNDIVACTYDGTQFQMVSPARVPVLSGNLSDVAGLAVTNGGFIVGDGSNFVLETGATAFTSIKQAATASATGVVELATDAETNTGSSTTLAITPANLTAWTGDTAVVTVGTVATGTWQGTAVASAYMASATASAKGAAELATTAETVTGTDTGRVVTPAGLHGALAGLTDTTITASDAIIFSDATDSGALKEDTVQGILDLAGGGAWNIIGTSVASNSASVTVTGLDSTYDSYAVGISDMHPASDNIDALIRFGDSSGIDSGASDYAYHTSVQAEGASAYSAVGSTGTTSIPLSAANIGNDTGEGIGGMLFLHRPGDGIVQPIISGTCVQINATAGALVTHTVFGSRNALITLDRIQFLFGSGNIVSGRLTVWGIAHG